MRVLKKSKQKRIVLVTAPVISRHLSSLPKKLDFADKYESGRVESGWYEWWKTSGLFKESSSIKGDASDADNRFTMILPPPNVTGTLHLGHALTVAVQVRIWFGGS